MITLSLLQLAKYCCVYVCLSLCPLAYVSTKSSAAVDGPRDALSQEIEAAEVERYGRRTCSKLHRPSCHDVSTVVGVIHKLDRR